MTKIGQKTGMLKASKNVQNKAIRIALVEPYLKKIAKENIQQGFS